MPRYKVHLTRTDHFEIDVEADNSDDAAEAGREAICQSEDPWPEHGVSSEGFETIWVIDSAGEEVARTRRFEVIITRDTTESVSVCVEAENEEAAKDAAFDHIHNSEDPPDWQPDDPATSGECYVTSITETSA